MTHIPIEQIPIEPATASPTNEPMELIIKPTEACNFACTFCSSSQISDEHTRVLNPTRVFDFLARFPKTNTIIINGGDPLMVDPDYYWKIITFLDYHNMSTSLAFTSNLWAFYKKPAKWVDLFRNERVGVTTSFNYGDTRRITPTRVYTDTDFWKISDLFLDLIGYRPDFISVINDDNEDTALANVNLAYNMDVECKLNYAMSSGEQSTPYLLAKMYKVYLDVYDRGLTKWEFNTKQMIRRLSTGNTVCPQHRECDTFIRAINPGGDYYSCGAFGDDKEYSIDFYEEIYDDNHFRPLSQTGELHCLKPECLTCSMFKICNGCKKTVFDLKKHSVVEQHCELMKQLAPRIEKINNECII